MYHQKLHNEMYMALVYTLTWYGPITTYPHTQKPRNMMVTHNMYANTSPAAPYRVLNNNCLEQHLHIIPLISTCLLKDVERWKTNYVLIKKKYAVYILENI